MPQNETGPRPDDAASRKAALDGLRREIDALDDALLSLVEQRVAAARAIAEIKRGDTDSRLRMRPAREAAVVERLAASAGDAPEGLVRQVWREIMACCLNLQVETEIVLHAPDHPAELVDAMRHRFGCAAPMSIASGPAEALDAARHLEAVAVIEIAADDDWWVALRSDPLLAMFECLRDEDGRLLGIAIGRVAAEDLTACPNLAIVTAGSGGGDVLASAQGFDLLLRDPREDER
jgi:chorismate mutase